MRTPELLLRTLEDLKKDNFEKFKFYLSHGLIDGYKKIPRARLEEASPVNVVEIITMIQGEELARKLTLDILRSMDCNAEADELESLSSGVTTAELSIPPTPEAIPDPPEERPTRHHSVTITPEFIEVKHRKWNVSWHKKK